MAEFQPVDRSEEQYGHELAEARLEHRVRIHVDFRNAYAGRISERLQRRAHLVAQLTICADEQRQFRRSRRPRLNDYCCSPLPFFSVV